jgi:hypothetical protein
MTSAIITNPFYIQGRIDGSNNVPFTSTIKVENVIASPDDFIEYCKGYGSIRASLDYDLDILSNISAWPQAAQDEYNKQYKILEFIIPK